MVECVKCHIFGQVDDYTEEEWREAFYAPSNPYIWKGGNDRIEV